MKPNAFDHPKTARFVLELGVRPREAWGMFDRLIAVTAQYAPRGNVGSVFTDELLAQRLDWTGEDETPERLISALLISGFLDPHPVHRYVLHDWDDHAPDYTKKKVRKDGGTWAFEDVQEIPEKSERVDGTTAGPSLPFPSLPSPSPPCGEGSADAPHTTDVMGFVRMLKGTTPTGLDGETWETPAAWFEAHAEIIRGEAEAQTGETSGTKFNGAFKSVLMRFWRNKSPPARGAANRPSRLEKMAKILQEQGECDVQRAEQANQGHQLGDREDPQTSFPGDIVRDLSDRFRPT